MTKLRFTTVGFLGLFLHGLLMAAPGAILPQWTAEFNQEIAMDMYYNIFLIGGLIGLRLTSTQANRHPRLFLAFTSTALGLGIGGVSTNFTGILITAFLVGLGNGAINLQSNSLVGELNPQNRIQLLNWANATFGLGALICPMLAIVMPWRGLFALVAAIACLCAIISWQAPRVANFNPSKDKMPWGKALPFLLIIIFYTGLEGSLSTWSSQYLIYLGWSTTFSVALLSVYWASLTLGRFSLVKIVEKKPLTALAWLSFLGLVAFRLTLIPTTAFLFPVVAFCNSALFATIFALVQMHCGHVALIYLFYFGYMGNIFPALCGLITNPGYLPYGFLAIHLFLCLMIWRVKLK